MIPLKLRAIACASLMLGGTATLIAGQPGTRLSISSPILIAADDPRGESGGVSRSVPTTAKDASITAVVKTKLLADPDVAGMKIDVDTFNKVVMLSGTVASQAQADRAVALAKEADGVTSVTNHLTVTAPDSTLGADAAVGINTDASDKSRTVEATAKDAAITALVKSKLLADPDVSGMRIDVDTRNKVVMLTGTVASKAQADRAIKLAKEADGVSTVQSRLMVAKK